MLAGSLRLAQQIAYLLPSDIEDGELNLGLLQQGVVYQSCGIKRIRIILRQTEYGWRRIAACHGGHICLNGQVVYGPTPAIHSRISEEPKADKNRLSFFKESGCNGEVAPFKQRRRTTSARGICGSTLYPEMGIWGIGICKDNLVLLRKTVF